MAETVQFVIAVETASGQVKVDQLGSAVENLNDKAGRAGSQVKSTGQELSSLGDEAGKADSIMQALAGTLDTVSPAAAGAARGVGDLLGGIEAVTRIGGPSIALMGALAVAVAAAGFAFKAAADDLVEAEEKMKAAAEAAEDAQRISERIGELRLDAAVRRGETLEEEAVLIRANAEAAEEFASQRLRAAQALTSAQEALAAETRQIGESQAEFEARTIGLTSSVRAAAQQIDNLSEAESALALELFEVGNAQIEAKRRADELAASRDAAAAAARRQREAEAAFIALVSFGAEEIGRQQIGIELAALDAETEALLRFFSGSLSEQEIDALTVPVRFSGVGRGLAEASAFFQNFASEQAALQFRLQQQSVASALGGAGQVAGLAGSPVSALTAAGPAGALLGTLAGIGAAGGAEGLTVQVENFADNVEAGIAALPEILTEVIPAFQRAMTVAVFEGTIQLGANIINAVKDVFKGEEGFFGSKGGDTRARTLGRLGVGIATGGVSELAGFGDEIGDFFSGAFQEGGTVERTGFALVHAGEEVLNEGQARAFRGSGFGSPSVSVDMRGAFVGQDAGNELVRTLESVLGVGGVGTVNIAGIEGGV